MATILQQYHFLQILLIILTVLRSTADADAGETSYFSTSDINRHQLKQKMTHFRVYWHDILSGKRPTSVQVVKPPPSNNFKGFGLINMFDNPLTVEPELGSKIVGRSQGFYGLASQEDIALLVAMNFVFVEGKYNASTITIQGRNAIFNSVRELPVIGGSGLFRFATGYAQARTHSLDLKSGDATVEYNVYVLHY